MNAAQIQQEEDRRKEPRVLGKFNFITVKSELWDVLFIPYTGNVIVKIAVNLTRTEMEALRDELNDCLTECWNDINQRTGSEPPVYNQEREV